MEEDKITTASLPGEGKAPCDAYAGYIRRKRLVLVVLFVAVVGIAVFSMTMGSLQIAPLDVVRAVFGQGDVRTVAAVQNIRLPRVLTAIVAGVALALARCAYQSVLRNPLASASTLGTSQGAAFGASLAIIVFAGGAGASAAYGGISTADPVTTALFAFAGAMLSTVVILLSNGLANG